MILLNSLFEKIIYLPPELIGLKIFNGNQHNKFEFKNNPG